ncbi:hypothetical protein SAMN05216532_8527 [Streptomyces sp. 2231.1]|nr:hypothetical protein SAMN05216532_8527 [Streptomyces sp. 2231.1]
MSNQLTRSRIKLAKAHCGRQAIRPHTIEVHPSAQAAQFGVDTQDTVSLTGGEVQHGDLVREPVVGGLPSAAGALPSHQA